MNIRNNVLHMSNIVINGGSRHETEKKMVVDTGFNSCYPDCGFFRLEDIKGAYSTGIRGVIAATYRHRSAGNAGDIIIRIRIGLSCHTEKSEG